MIKRFYIFFVNRQTILLILTIIVACIYFLINIPQSTLHVMKIAIDDSIPRIPLFSIPYLFFLPWFWGVVVYAWYKKRFFTQLALASIIVNILAYIVYLTFQTYIERSVIVENDIFSVILGFIYANDQAYNGFPSLHSALSAVVASYFVLSRSKYAGWFVGVAALIVVSTLLVKQHYLLDAVSGVSLGTVVTWLVFKYKHKLDKWFIIKT